jgi:hypothetical protein
MSCFKPSDQNTSIVKFLDLSHLDWRGREELEGQQWWERHGRGSGLQVTVPLNPLMILYSVRHCSGELNEFDYLQVLFAFLLIKVSLESRCIRTIVR